MRVEKKSVLKINFQFSLAFVHTLILYNYKKKAKKKKYLKKYIIFFKVDLLSRSPWNCIQSCLYLIAYNAIHLHIINKDFFSFLLSYIKNHIRLSLSTTRGRLKKEFHFIWLKIFYKKRELYMHSSLSHISVRFIGVLGYCWVKCDSIYLKP